MALIKCSECGKEISDKAKICVHCGCPQSTISVSNFIRVPIILQTLVKSKFGKRLVLTFLGLVGIIALFCLCLQPKYSSNIDGYWVINDVYGEWLFAADSSVIINKNGTFVIEESSGKIYSGEYKFNEIRHDVVINLDDGERLEPDVYVYSLKNCDFNDCDENEEIEILYYSFVIDGHKNEAVKFQKREADTKRPTGWIILNFSKNAS